MLKVTPQHLVRLPKTKKEAQGGNSGNNENKIFMKLNLKF